MKTTILILLLTTGCKIQIEKETEREVQQEQLTNYHTIDKYSHAVFNYKGHDYMEEGNVNHRVILHIPSCICNSNQITKLP